MTDIRLNGPPELVAAAFEILDRMFEAGTLVRELDESGARRHHHYVYLDATKKDGNEFGW